MSLPQTGTKRSPGFDAGMSQVSSWSRDIRLVSGFVLLVFATTHFLNHAVGIAGVAAMEQVQEWRYAVWHSWPGTVALYGALIVHPLFALVRVAQRRTFRMPVREILQIALGLAIPLLLVDHIVSTRIIGHYFHIDESYHAVLRRLWPGHALAQSLLLLLVWTHGMIGLHFILRSRDSYARWRDPFLLVAILIPVLALIGFSVAAREAVQMALPPEARNDARSAMSNWHEMWVKSGFFGLVGAFAIFVAFREFRVRTTRAITVRFVGHGVRKVVPGPTVLELFRRFNIPHAALCGGRARCATCRVLVLDGADGLPAPGPNEAKLLRRISAPPRVRLACQIRPRDDLQVQLLLASKLGSAIRAVELDSSIARRGLTVMVADLRAFSALSERQLPHELIGLLNRFFDEMAQAIIAHGGRIDALYGDGFMAVFGLEASPAKAALASIAAAGDIVRAVDALNREFSAALPLPLRIGIGIHTGQAVVGAVENDSLGRHEITVGETVAIASQFEAATRRVLADIVVSETTVAVTGRSFAEAVPLKVMIKGRDAPMAAYGFARTPRIDAADEADAVDASAVATQGATQDAGNGEQRAPTATPTPANPAGRRSKTQADQKPENQDV
ncbi:adenylate/guanylate cyclase domain-containing protein [Bosea sp. 2RAB26]|uniref:adenylate/guanylate cyclase domain-containing protein n=1 Tax=Bosea sp. 2RAB26 TaxID=3237476 RepID=UPI003F8F0641